jgi:WD40 repeat protein
LPPLSAQTQQLRLVAPAQGERLTPGGEFLIQWSGVSAQDTVQISFSSDAGRTWQLVTPLATGLAFRWRNIPFSVSDSCIMAITTKPRDVSASVQNSIQQQSRAFALQYGQRRSSARWLNRWAGFTFDGSRLLTTQSVGNDDSLRQLYRTQIWDAVSGQRLFALPDFIRDSSLRFSASTFTPRVVQGAWSPDNTLILSVIDENSFGIYEAASGRLVRRVSIPADGFKTSLQYLTWSNDGREMIARVLYRVQGTGGAGTVIADRLIRYALNDMQDTPTTIFSYVITFDRWGNTSLGLLPNARQWLSVRRSQATGQVEELVLHTPNNTDSIRSFPPPSGFIWQPETLLSSPNSDVVALRAAPTAPNRPSLLVLLNLQTGVQRSIGASRAIAWSPDGKKLLVKQDNSAQAEILDVETLRMEASLQSLHTASSGLVLSTTNIVGFVPTAETTILWGAGGRRIIGYTQPSVSGTSPMFTGTTSASTLGVWDVANGCMTDILSLPRLPSSPLPTQYSLSEVASLIANNGENQIVLTHQVNDTTLVLPLPSIGASCQTALSSGRWAIRLPNLLQAPETITAAPVVCETSALVRVPVASLADFALQLETQIQSLSGAELNEREFRLERGVLPLLANRAFDTVLVRFTPQTFGNSSVQVVVRNLLDNLVIARTIINVRKDSLAFEPAAPIVNLGLIPANTIITTTITIRNTGNTPLLWSTSASRTTLGNIFVSEITPLLTPVGGTAELRLRVQPVDSLGLLRTSFPIYRCGANTSVLTVQARVLPEFQQIEAPAAVNGGLLTCVGTITRTVVLRNVGGRPLTVRIVSIADTNFRIVNRLQFPLTLAPLDSLVLTLRLSTPNNGIRESRLSVLSDDQTRALLEIPVRLEQQAPIYSWIPAQYRFENVDIRQPAEATLEFQNTGQAYLWDRLPRQISPDFSIVSAVPNPTPQGGTSRVTVRFGGNALSGITTTLASFNLGDICNTQSQLSLEAITVQPAAKLTVRTIRPFDTLLCENEQTQRAELLNTGRADLRIDSIYVESSIGAGRSPNPDFLVRLDNAAPFPVRIGGVQTIAQVFFLNIVFRPQASGLRENWLVFHSNDTTGGSRGITRILLTGFRQLAAFTLTPDVVRFQVQSDFMRDTTSVILTNTGTERLVWQGFPRTIDPLFSLERIEPAVTPPQGTSRVVLRFSGSRMNENTSGSYTLSNPLCNAAQVLRFSAGSAPEAALASVQSLSARLLCAADTTLQLTLLNTGNAPLTFSEAPRVLDDAFGEVRIVQTPMMIAPGATGTLRVNIRPQRTGTRSVRVLLATNDRFTPQQEPRITFTKDSSGLVFEPVMLNLGNIRIGESIRRTVRVRNVGTVEQRINTGLQGTNVVGDSVTPNPIPAGGSAEIIVRMMPTNAMIMNGIFSGSLSLQDSCARVSILTVRGTVQDGEIAMPDTLQLAPLQEAQFPIFLRKRTGLSAGDTVHLTFRIANTSLLQVLSPTSTAQGLRENRVSGGARILRLSLPVQAVSDTLVSLRLRGLLGNDSSTTLHIDSARVGETALRGSVSRFRTVGLNFAGSAPRLYFAPSVRFVAPNPASGRISVKIDAVESALISLHLVNVLGQSLTLFEGSIGAGEQDIELPLDEVPTGTYSLELRSRPQRFPSAALERSAVRVNVVK